MCVDAGLDPSRRGLPHRVLHLCGRQSLARPGYSQPMNPSRHYVLSSGADLLDAVHKEIVALPSEDLKHYEVLIYEGECLPGSGTTGGLRVTHRHPNAASAHLQADEEYAKSLAIGWLVAIRAQEWC